MSISRSTEQAVNKAIDDTVVEFLRQPLPGFAQVTHGDLDAALVAILRNFAKRMRSIDSDTPVEPHKITVSYGTLRNMYDEPIQGTESTCTCGETWVSGTVGAPFSNPYICPAKQLNKGNQ
jgi:hypothetical protein